METISKLNLHVDKWAERFFAMRPCGSNQQNGGRRSVNQRNLLPRPQSHAFETGGKLIIKTSGGAGKYGKRRKVPISPRSCFALVSKLSMIAFILPNPLVSFFSHKMNRACGGRSENVSLHWALGCMNSFHFSARVGYPRYSCKRDIVYLLLLLDVSRKKSLPFASPFFQLSIGLPLTFLSVSIIQDGGLNIRGVIQRSHASNTPSQQAISRTAGPLKFMRESVWLETNSKMFLWLTILLQGIMSKTLASQLCFILDQLQVDEQLRGHFEPLKGREIRYLTNFLV